MLNEVIAAFDASVRQYCKAVRMPTIAANFLPLAEQATKENHSHIRYLEALLAMESEERDRHAIANRVRDAQLPRMKTLEEFDYSFQTSVTRRMRGAYLGTALVAGGRPASMTRSDCMADHADVSERVREIAPDNPPAARAAPRSDVPGKEGEVRELERDDRSTRQEDNLRRTERSPQRRRIPWAGILGAIVVIVLVIAGGTYWWAGRNDESTDDAFTDGNAVIVEPHVTGYVITLAVNDNEFVHKGQLLVKIDPRDFIAARDQADRAGTSSTLPLSMCTRANVPGLRTASWLGTSASNGNARVAVLTAGPMLDSPPVQAQSG